MKAFSRFAELRHDDKGAAAVEWVILLPALLVLICVGVGGARLAYAKQHITDATAAAARAATVQRSASAAEVTASNYLRANLEGCELVSSAIDVSALRQEPGTPGRVHVSVLCRVKLADLLVPGLPGNIDVRTAASSVVDTYARRNR